MHLLDEPFSAVDRGTRKLLYAELRRLHEQLSATVVLVTYDLDDAAHLASHLVLLADGRALQTGPTAQVLTRPTCEAARLLDIPNIFEAVLDAGGPGNGTLLLRWARTTCWPPDPCHRMPGRSFAGRSCRPTSCSQVILAMGLTPEEALGSVRLTLGRSTTQDDVEQAAAALVRSWRCGLP